MKSFAFLFILAITVFQAIAQPISGAESVGGYYSLKFKNGKILTGEIVDSDTNYFMLRSIEGAIRFPWKYVTHADRITPDAFYQQEALKALKMNKKDEAVLLVNKARMINPSLNLDGNLKGILRDRQNKELSANSMKIRKTKEDILKQMDKHAYENALAMTMKALRDYPKDAELLSMKAACERGIYKSEIHGNGMLNSIIDDSKGNQTDPSMKKSIIVSHNGEIRRNAMENQQLQAAKKYSNIHVGSQSYTDLRIVLGIESIARSLSRR